MIQRSQVRLLTAHTTVEVWALCDESLRHHKDLKVLHHSLHGKRTAISSQTQLDQSRNESETFITFNDTLHGVK